MISFNHTVPYVCFDNVKTGSTTVRKILAGYKYQKVSKHTKIVEKDYDFLDQDSGHMLIIKDHSFEYFKIKNQKRIIYMDLEDYNKIYKFGLVRNPYDRILSLFRFSLKKNSRMLRDNNFRDLNKKSFERYLTDFVDKGAAGYNAMQLYDCMSYNDSIKNINLVRFENFKADLKKVLKELEIDVSTIPHFKKMKKLNYKNYYTENSKKIIERVYKKDLEKFNYVF